MAESTTSLVSYIRSKPYPQLKNNILIRAARGEAVERAPVWLFRQTGHYLKEFRDFHQLKNITETYENPKYASQMTILPLNHIDVDAVIIFADTFAILSTLGIKFEKTPTGSNICNPLMDPEDTKRLNRNIELKVHLQHIFEAISLTRHDLGGRVPLIGFSLDPWSLLAYMIEGFGTTKWFRAKSWLYKYRDTSHSLLEDLFGIVIDFLVQQYQAGAQILLLINPLGGALSKDLYMEFCYPYIKKIASGVRERLEDPTIILMFYSQGTQHVLKEIFALDYNIIGLDWAIDPQIAREQAGPTKVLMGNLDPVALLLAPEELETTTKKMIDQFGKQYYVANVGDGIFPPTEVENVKVFINSVKSYTAQCEHD